MKALQDLKERGEYALPDCLLYFRTYCRVWIKDWITLSEKRLISLKS